MQDLNRLFHTAKPMHDDFVTAVTCTDQALVLEYGRIGEWGGDYGSFQKVTVTYTLCESDPHVGISAYRVTTGGHRAVDLCLEELNGCSVVLSKYAVDHWGEMTLYLEVRRGRQNLNAEVFFTPTAVRYFWE